MGYIQRWYIAPYFSLRWATPILMDNAPSGLLFLVLRVTAIVGILRSMFLFRWAAPILTGLRPFMAAIPCLCVISNVGILRPMLSYSMNRYVHRTPYHLMPTFAYCLSPMNIFTRMFFPMGFHPSLMDNALSGLLFLPYGLRPSLVYCALCFFSDGLHPSLWITPFQGYYSFSMCYIQRWYITSHALLFDEPIRASHTIPSHATFAHYLSPMTYIRACSFRWATPSP